MGQDAEQLGEGPLCCQTSQLLEGIVLSFVAVASLVAAYSEHVTVRAQAPKLNRCVCVCLWSFIERRIFRAACLPVPVGGLP